MPLVTWDRGLETGHALIDAQHRSLVGALNDLDRAKDRQEAEHALLALVRVTESHFRDEEDLMAAGGHPLSGDHRTRHGNLLSQIRGLLEQLRQDRTALTQSTLDFLKVWLVKHIKEEDLPQAQAWVDSGEPSPR